MFRPIGRYMNCAALVPCLALPLAAAGACRGLGRGACGEVAHVPPRCLLLLLLLLAGRGACGEVAHVPPRCLLLVVLLLLPGEGCVRRGGPRPSPVLAAAAAAFAARGGVRVVRWPTSLPGACCSMYA